jgi:hypothetical protein
MIDQHTARNMALYIDRDACSDGNESLNQSTNGNESIDIRRTLVVHTELLSIDLSYLSTDKRIRHRLDLKIVIQQRTVRRLSVDAWRQCEHTHSIA